MIWIFQLLALMKKEFLAIWSDKKSRTIIIIPPLIQLLLFSFAITLEVKNINIAVLDRDNSTKSQEIIRSLSYSNSFTNIYRLNSEKELTEYIDTQKALVVLYIPQNFAQKIAKNENVSIQIIADGRKSNSSQIAQGYIQSAIQKVVNNSPITNTIITRNLYNPNLDNFWWVLPNLMGSLSMLIALLLTSLSVARERELGTFEQLLVSPLSTTILIIGKTIPPLLISIVEASFIFFVAIVFFKVPFVGSILILYAGLVAFLFSIVGLGLFISSISSTQQQGILGAFVLMVPYILMSGFATPVENMPQWLIPFTDIISLKYFLILLKGVFLKDINFDMAISLIVPMLALGFISLIFASWMFRKKIQ
ncbi:ABC transporter permease [Arcobacter sp. s6]|uniref:ABC transporter permease n=1 Tax=Arcobacter sp. s6 TaxID=3230363 RepID=UPI00349FF5F2